ncbi:hypothetical protein P171DRAFT_472070 [Karstenula rhodostoma CBS 690.94]|uniref:Uncharacterized protein n=1 Tax=Karstenula rhodostoma CBS 690.94 TaxID=1392251 RepID=A0A9P4PLW1_9PLEO|nr:hypothetical protein P171DRAFT_472070 [Karstenula rhodostoma CBS 690.94]
MHALHFLLLVLHLLGAALAGRTIPKHPPGTSDYDIAASILKDQGLPDPQLGKTYAFALYWRGNTMENICNGGAHAAIALAQFDEGKWFGGIMFELTNAIDDTVKKGIRAKHRGQIWLPHVSMENANVLVDAMGLVRQDMDMFKLSELVDDKSTEYFAKSPDYNYVLNNCGNYVNYIMGVIGTDYQAYGDLPGEKKPN